ncbi:MAG: HAD family hydrolase [Bacteroidales bacterium]
MRVKGFLFDMDGVLFDSMRNHTRSWVLTMNSWGVPCSEEEFYLHEGRTGGSTTNLLFKRTFGRDATELERKEVYELKTKHFRSLPLAQPMEGALELLSTLKQQGYLLGVVTGSAQASLLGRIESSFPGIFSPEHIVSAHDVVKGKPDPEPYLKGLQKLGISASEAIVVENAPMGVESAKAAGIFTITLNTGPLSDSMFHELNTDRLYPTMRSFCDDWDRLSKELNTI